MFEGEFDSTTNQLLNILAGNLLDHDTAVGGVADAAAGRDAEAQSGTGISDIGQLFDDVLGGASTRGLNPRRAGRNAHRGSDRENDGTHDKILL